MRAAASRQPTKPTPALHQRVDSLDSASAQLGQHVGTLDSARIQITERLGTLDANATELAHRVGSVNGEVIRVRNDVAAVQPTGPAAVSTLGAEVQSLTERLNATPALPPLEAALPRTGWTRSKNSAARSRRCPTPSPLQSQTPVVDPADISALAERLDALSADLTAPHRSGPTTQSLKPTARPRCGHGGS